MDLAKLPRRPALQAAALVLLAALVFLFVKTEGSGYKAQAQALALLREMKDVDTRWDLEAHRLADDLAARRPAASDPSTLLARMFQEMEQPDTRRALGEAIGPIRAGIAEKQQAFRSLRQTHAQTMQKLEGARQALEQLAAQLPAAKARDPAAVERLATLGSAIEQLGGLMRAADIESHAQFERAVEPMIATLAAKARLGDPRIAAAAANAEAAAREFVHARGDEAAAWRKFAFLTVGGRIDMLARELGTAIDNALVEKDRWRVYLVAYAAALLLAIGYLATRVIAADAALRAANQDLEKRVADRTSDLTRTLQQLKESEAQLVQTEKMSSLGMLVAGVAHEINTPLAYVKSNMYSVREHLPELRAAIAESGALVSLLQSEGADAAQLQQAFTSLSERLRALSHDRLLDELESLSKDGLHGIEQISELVTNLKNFSRVDRSHVASFNVNDSVTSAFLIARTMLRKVDVEKNLGDIPSITCSPSQINQVVLNLVTNAVQAIEKPRGRIVATTRREGEDAVAIEISDDGGGIAPEHLRHIFDPFFTTKQVGGGTGLGLSIAYKIVAQHGGHIDVRSTVGQGSTFTVVLPFHPPPMPDETSREGTVAA